MTPEQWWMQQPNALFKISVHTVLGSLPFLTPRFPSRDVQLQRAAADIKNSSPAEWMNGNHVERHQLGGVLDEDGRP